MNNKLIIGLILLIASVGAVWIWVQSPSRKMRPAVEAQAPQAASGEALATVYAQVVCPEPECAKNGETLGMCDCETAVEVKGQIRLMMDRGLTAEGVLSHLRMMGMVPGDPGLPEGHPPIDAQPKQEPKPNEEL